MLAEREAAALVGAAEALAVPPTVRRDHRILARRRLAARSARWTQMVVAAAAAEELVGVQGSGSGGGLINRLE